MASAQGFSGHSAKMMPLGFCAALKSRPLTDICCTFSGLHKRPSAQSEPCWLSHAPHNRSLLPLWNKRNDMAVAFAIAVKFGNPWAGVLSWRMIYCYKVIDWLMSQGPCWQSEKALQRQEQVLAAAEPGMFTPEQLTWRRLRGSRRSLAAHGGLGRACPRPMCPGGSLLSVSGPVFLHWPLPLGCWRPCKDIPPPFLAEGHPCNAAA